VHETFDKFLKLYCVVVWLIGNALISINEVTQRRAPLVLGQVPETYLSI